MQVSVADQSTHSASTRVGEPATLQNSTPSGCKDLHEFQRAVLDRGIVGVRCDRTVLRFHE